MISQEKVPNSSFASWGDLLNCVKDDYESSMIFSDKIVKKLQRIPFEVIIAEKAYELLGILDQIHQSLDYTNKRSAEGNELYRKHFYGTSDNVYFSNESEKNRRLFRDKLTFRHPINRTPIMCSWHGKISRRKFRIHFSHPPENRDERIYIAYIGPKITKR
ncbi:MAG: hypothetical protein AAF639_20940 [Chloroflexota bacterium]